MRRRALLSSLKYEKGSITDNYLTIVALQDGLTAKLSTNSCEYCVDGDGVWKTLDAATATEAINTGQKLSFRGELTPTTSAGVGTFTISAKCNLEGNCMSLIAGDKARSQKSLAGYNYAFYFLFKNCTNVVNVSANFLPATTLSQYCYREMFRGCSSLKTAPELPAISLQDGCYAYMYTNCTKLQNPPSVLPATTLKPSCYNNMFSNCKALVKGPIIKATTLATQCCRYMFQNCSNLMIAPELLATTLASYCYGNMFTNCTNLRYIKALFTTISASSSVSNWVSGVNENGGLFVKNPNATWEVYGANGIPAKWTVKMAEEENSELVNFYLTHPTVGYVTYEFRAEKGMTWGEFINSNYNTDEHFYSSGNEVWTEDGTPIADDKGNIQLLTDVIMDGFIYFLYID